MKSRKFKKIISSVCLLLLAIIMIFSFPVSHVFAQSNTFAGTKIVITTFEKLSEEITEQWVTKDNAAENLVLPKELNATDENGQTILVEGIVWEHEKLNSENQDQEKYLFTAKLPEGYVLKEGVTMPTITVIVEGAKGTQIIFENGIHYIIDPDYPDHKITLFCMNNKLHWPHHTEDMGELQVPGYTDGYLTPDDFKSQKEYEECMRRLSKLLYAGYPYNGERLYQIVTNSSEYTPTEADRIRTGFRSGTWIGVIYAVVTGAIVFFAGKYMTVLFVSENVAAITNYVDIYLKCVGVSFIPLVFVNVYRNGIQGMGYGLLPMTAGIAELIGRSSAALIASYAGSYAGICMASPVAWVLAGGLLLLMYRWIMKSRNLL